LSQKKNKSAIKQRSTWIASMVACLAFLLMAVKVYGIPVSEMTSNLLLMVIGTSMVMGAAALLGRLIVILRKRC
jgi:hypothetical protein